MLHARVKEVFSGFPPEFLWHLLMDYNRRDQGCDAFEKVGVAGGEKPESHYLNGVFAASILCFKRWISHYPLTIFGRCLIMRLTTWLFVRPILEAL